MYNFFIVSLFVCCLLCKYTALIFCMNSMAFVCISTEFWMISCYVYDVKIMNEMNSIWMNWIEVFFVSIEMIEFWYFIDLCSFFLGFSSISSPISSTGSPTLFLLLLSNQFRISEKKNGIKLALNCLRVEKFEFWCNKPMFTLFNGEAISTIAFLWFLFLLLIFSAS